MLGQVIKIMRALAQLPAALERLSAVEANAHAALSGLEDLEALTRELYVGDTYVTPQGELPMCDACRESPGRRYCTDAACVTNAKPAPRGAR